MEQNEKARYKKWFPFTTYDLDELNNRDIAYLLLRYGLRKEYGINENVVLSEGSCGKPYLSNYPFVHFNLSHCDKGVACMISDSAVGIDITSVKKENICHY